MPSAPSEYDIQAEILERLRWIPRCKVERCNTGAGRGGKVRYGERGAPDIRITCEGRSIAIEVKRSEKEKPTKDQQKWAAEFCAAGGRYWVIWDAAQAELSLRRFLDDRLAGRS